MCRVVPRLTALVYRDRICQRMGRCLSTSATATAVTTTTTAVAFGSNAFSLVAPLRVCGYFSAIAVIANWCMTFTFFFAVIVLRERTRDCCRRCCNMLVFVSAPLRRCFWSGCRICINTVLFWWEVMKDFTSSSNDESKEENGGC